MSGSGGFAPERKVTVWSAASLVQVTASPTLMVIVRGKKSSSWTAWSALSAPLATCHVRSPARAVPAGTPAAAARRPASTRVRILRVIIPLPPPVDLAREETRRFLRAPSTKPQGAFHERFWRVPGRAERDGPRSHPAGTGGGGVRRV